MVGSSFHLATMHAGDCEGLHDRSVEVDTPFLFFFPAPHCSHAPCVVLPSTDVHPHHGCIFQARVWHAILNWTRATMDAMGMCVVFSQPRDPWICSVSLFLSCYILIFHVLHPHVCVTSRWVEKDVHHFDRPAIAHAWFRGGARKTSPTRRHVHVLRGSHNQDGKHAFARRHHVDARRRRRRRRRGGTHPRPAVSDTCERTRDEA